MLIKVEKTYLPVLILIPSNKPSAKKKEKKREKKQNSLCEIFKSKPCKHYTSNLERGKGHFLSLRPNYPEKSRHKEKSNKLTINKVIIKLTVLKATHARQGHIPQSVFYSSAPSSEKQERSTFYSSVPSLEKQQPSVFYSSAPSSEKQERSVFYSSAPSLEKQERSVFYSSAPSSEKQEGSGTCSREHRTAVRQHAGPDGHHHHPNHRIVRLRQNHARTKTQKKKLTTLK